jgi:trimethylamine--corrinoid protein Co-methyltransferase
MSDPPPPARRRPSSRGTRTTGPSLAALPRLQVPWAPLEILTPEQVERILDAACRVLEDAGLEIRSTAARDVYRKAGAIVDDATQLVRLGRDLVEAQLALAPGSFVLHSRNPERHLYVGGNTVNFGPVNGAPNATDLERGRRYGDLAAFRDILKLTHTLGVLHWQGGIVVEPVDVAIPVRHLAAYRAHVECSDIVWAARGVGGVQAEDAVAMSAIEHRCSVEDLVARPTLMSVTNVNSPRRVDEEILDNVMAMSRHGQCVVITPFTLMGAMAPVTLAGALVQQTAEALGIIALCQLVRPGAPCVMGGFTSNVDMRTGSPAFGTPEYVHAALATAQIGRRLGIPVRTSAVNAAPTVDAQSTYETAFSLQAAILSHSHLINHAAGWLEGGLSASFEKIVVDAEMLRAWAEMLKPVEFDDDDLALEAIGGVEPGGHFFGSPHTLARYEKAFYRPLLSDWSNFENWKEAGSRDATHRATEIWKRLLAEYSPPPLDADVREAIDAYVARRSDELGAPLRS